RLRTTRNNSPAPDGNSQSQVLTARLARWLGNWLPCNVSRVRFPHGTTLCVIHRLLFRVWVSCACEIRSSLLLHINYKCTKFYAPTFAQFS
ncbi:hypothetical protein SFRURICE_010764, partial [Spodoptera frugiperda]